MIGVPINEPNTPPFEMVNVPPAMSSGVIFPSLPLFPRSSKALSTSAKFRVSQFRMTGTSKPLGVATATDMSI